MRFFSLFALFLFAGFSLNAQNIPRANFSGPMGAEVNTYNGNLYLERTDVSIPNQDLPLAVSFSFNSFRDSTASGYGFGWRHAYSVRFEETAGAVVIERAHGRRDTFSVSNEQYQAPPGIFDVLTSPAPGSYRLATREGMVYAFNEPAHRYLTQLTNANGRFLNFTYTDTLLTTVTDAGGRSISLSYQGGRLSSVDDNNFPGGRSWAYTYLPDGQLSTVTDPLGNFVTYNYDPAGRLVNYTDERGSGLDISYAADGRVATLRTCITEVGFAFNEAQGRTTISEQNDGSDQLTTHVYDREGRLVRKTGNCCGYDQAFAYDGSNNLAETTDANGNTVLGTYDDLGNTVAVQDALSERQAFTFGTLNRMTSYTDKRGNTTSMTYDGNGNLRTLRQPENVNLNMQYDGRGNLTQLANGLGNATRMTYNANNDLTEVRYPIGRELYGYDGAGNMVSSTDPNGNAVLLTYDALNRLTKVVDAEGDSTRYEYDAASNLTAEIDGKGQRRSYAYDAHDRLTSVETEIGITRYTYDKLDNLTSITNAEGHTSHFAYDTRSRLTIERDAMGFATFYEYDANGNVITRTDANMQVTRYTYDAQNRLLSKSYPGNTDNYSYDANGNLVRAANDNITYEFTYDGLNRMTRKYVVEWDKAIEYQYDRNGNRTQMKDPDGGITRYIYDTNDRLLILINPFNETFRFTYDDAGRLLQQNNFNGTYSTYEYDQANHLTLLRNLKSDGSVISSYAYEYDANGMRTSMTDTEGLNAYTYDAENRLTDVRYADGTTERYEFDKAGNRTLLVEDGVETVYTYDAADRIQRAGNVTFNFDANGNMIRKTDGEDVTEFRWDGENRLVGVVGAEINISFEYDSFGKKTSKTESESSLYFLDDNDLDFYIFDESGTVEAYYTSGLLYDEWLSVRLNQDSYSFSKDYLGSINSMVSSEEEIVTTSSFNSFGLKNSSLELAAQSLGFTGREEIVENGLMYFRTRFYSPSTGRFLNKDSYDGFTDRPTSFNSFTYLENNPINYTDPTGEILPLLGGILFHGVRLAVTHIIKKVVVKKITKKAVKGFVGNAALNVADQVLIKKTKLGCIDWFDAGVDGVFGYSPFKFPGLGKGAFQALGKTTKTHASRQVFASQARTMKRLNLKRGTFKSAEDYNQVVRAYQKGNRIAAGDELVAEYIKGRVSGGLKDNVNGSLCDENIEGDQSPEDPQEPGRTDGNTTIPDTDINIPIIRPIDPNEIIGPEGIGDKKWVKGDATLPYTILYENDPEFATAAAQRVFVNHPFDDSVNPFSFRIGNFGFGSFFFEVPEDVSFYNTQLDLRDSLGVFLNVVAGIDIELNQAFWIFESVDPNTGLTATLPAEVGYLPVNDTITRGGEGFVNFTIQPSAAAELGDRIEAVANIIFDDNDAIVTNVEINTIDPERPTSGVTEIDTLTNGDYTLSWSAEETGSGLADVTLFTATNDGPFLPSATLTGQTGNYTFAGRADAAYQFFTIARDSVGNVERMKAVGEPACMSVTILNQTDAGANANNGTVEISVTGGSGNLVFDWEHDPDLNAPTAGSLAPGVYRVLVSDARGCRVEALVNIDQLNLSTAPATAPQIMKIYPVPSRNNITLEFYAPTDILSAVIYDATGRPTLRQTVNALRNQVNTQTFDVSSLPAGTYYFYLESPEGSRGSGVFFKQ